MKKGSFVVVFGVALLILTACMCFANVYAQEGTAALSATTLDNLMTAYQGELNAHTRYLAFAVKANEEGYDAAAGLFRAAALAEKVHYERHAEVIRNLGGMANAVVDIPTVNSTKENLEAALKGETYEKDVMYPAFLKQAKKENIKEAIDAFEDAGAAEGVHAEFYGRMIKNLTLSKGLTKDYYVCPVCGNVMDALDSKLCPICSTETKKFVRVR